MDVERLFEEGDGGNDLCSIIVGFEDEFSYDKINKLFMCRLCGV